MTSKFISKLLEPPLPELTADVLLKIETISREFGAFDHAVAAQEMSKALARDGKLHKPPFRGLVPLKEGL